MEPKDLALLAAEAAADKKAYDVAALDVGEMLVVTEYFVLATGSNDRQVRTIVDEVERQLREKGRVKPLGREGERDGKWVLLDFGDVVIHVFQPEEREFYRLERLWSDAPRLSLPDDVANPSRPVAGPSATDADGGRREAAGPGVSDTGARE